MGRTGTASLHFTSLHFTSLHFTSLHFRKRKTFLNKRQQSPVSLKLPQTIVCPQDMLHFVPKVSTRYPPLLAHYGALNSGFLNQPIREQNLKTSNSIFSAKFCIRKRNSGFVHVKELGLCACE
jgi:hypothetical protein